MHIIIDVTTNLLCFFVSQKSTKINFYIEKKNININDFVHDEYFSHSALGNKKKSDIDIKQTKVHYLPLFQRVLTTAVLNQDVFSF